MSTESELAEKLVNEADGMTRYQAAVQMTVLAVSWSDHAMEVEFAKIARAEMGAEGSEEGSNGNAR